MLAAVTPTIAYSDLAVLMLLDLVSILVFAVAIYFRRHHRRDLALVFSFFNICLFITVVVIQMTDVAAALGFGLFAILSIIRLRSEPFNNREIGYFFGALVLGLLNGVGTPDLWFTVLLNITILLAMFVLDHPRVMRGAERREVLLDQIITDQAALQHHLGQRLGATVVACAVMSVDFVKESMLVEVHCIPDESPATSATERAHLVRSRSL
jgi:Domain of unknown function (DUF4956)